MMAEAVGKLTGRPGIAMVTRGPGATNAAHGVHIAQQDSTPMILFVGQIERSARGRGAFQEVDYAAAFGPIAKWAVEIDDAARIPEIISRAFHVAMSGRPGPVVIALPEDMLVESADAKDAPYVDAVEANPSLSQMAQLQKRLWAAKNPIAIVGGSRWSQQAVDRLVRFSEAFKLPVAVSFRRQMLFPADHRISPAILASAQTGAAEAHQGGRSPARHWRAAWRDAKPGLFLVRYSGGWRKAHPCPVRRGGAWPGLCLVPADQCRHGGFRRRPADAPAAKPDSVGRRGCEAHSAYLAWSTPPKSIPGALQMAK